MPSLALLAKVLATTTAVGVTATVAGLGTFGTFTDTTSASLPVASGVVIIRLGAVGPANRLTVAATNIVPGDTVQRAFALSSTTTSSPLGTVALTTTATTTSLLDTDATNGLQFVLDKCSLPAGWTEAGTAPGYTYTCPAGTITSILTTRPMIGSAIPVTGLSSLVTPGATDQLLLTATLPVGASNSFQTQSSVVQLRFDATQRPQTGG